MLPRPSREAVAAEVNHERDRRRWMRLDNRALDVLEGGLSGGG